MSAVNIVIKPMHPEDWQTVRDIYQEGLATGTATFEKAVPDWHDWDAAHIEGCRLVAWDGRVIVGWAALSPMSDRSAYSGVAEVSVYVAASHRRRGIGKILLAALIKESEGAGFWTLQASLFPENSASLRLHLSCGFREVGHRERIGQLRGRWRDVLLLERRSPDLTTDG